LQDGCPVTATDAGMTAGPKAAQADRQVPDCSIRSLSLQAAHRSATDGDAPASAIGTKPASMAPTATPRPAAISVSATITQIAKHLRKERLRMT
jgi:hypothetical protein